MPKNWIFLSSASCAAGFAFTLIISQNIQKSSFAILTSVPAVVTSLALLSYQNKDETNRQKSNFKLRLHNLEKKQKDGDRCSVDPQILIYTPEDISPNNSQAFSESQDQLCIANEQIKSRDVEVSELSNELIKARNLLTEKEQELITYVKEFEPEKIRYRLLSARLIDKVTTLTAKNKELEFFCKNLNEDIDPLVLIPSIDLSSYKIAIVGGHNRIQREIKTLLTQQKLDPNKFIGIPPASEENNNEKSMRSKIQYCDLVVILPSYVDHTLTKIVSKLEEKKAVRASILYVSSGGTYTITNKIIERLKELRDLN
jgi:hypothetical protein